MNADPKGIDTRFKALEIPALENPHQRLLAASLELIHLDSFLLIIFQIVRSQPEAVDTIHNFIVNPHIGRFEIVMNRLQSALRKADSHLRPRSISLFLTDRRVRIGLPYERPAAPDNHFLKQVEKRECAVSRARLATGAKKILVQVTDSAGG